MARRSLHRQVGRLAAENAAGPATIDVSQLVPGTRVSYKDHNGVWHVGLVTALSESGKSATIALFMTLGGRPWLVREDFVTIDRVLEILGHEEVPVVPENPKDVKVVPCSPDRPQGYKDCDVQGCTKVIYAVVKTLVEARAAPSHTIQVKETTGDKTVRVKRQVPIKFKFGDLEEKDANLIALCRVHYTDRFTMGVLHGVFFEWPKPEPTNNETTQT